MKIHFIKNRIALIVLAMVCVNLFTGCMTMHSGMNPDMTDRGAGTVWMKHDSFSPVSITVPVNTTVKWTNHDLWSHTVTSDMGLFDSGKLHHGKSFSYKFTATGTYNYHCKIHDKMVAKIIVQ